jgi:iron-sulfur cluster assembly accessory protein
MALLDIQTDEITLTPAAVEAVKDLMAKRDLQGYFLRVYVGGGGCSGYQYGMALDDNLLENDHVFQHGEIRLVVDPMSYKYLHGATVDYVDELMGSGFQIDNPNAVASCGCGNSFRTSEDAEPSASGSCC